MTTLHGMSALALLVAIGNTPATAQPQRDGRAAIVQHLVDCRALTPDSVRLACYDTAAAALDLAEAKGDVVVVDRETARKVRRQTFGFTLPAINLFERGESAEDIETVVAKVAAASRNAAGKWVVELDEGATWVQVDSTDVFTPPKPGMAVKVRRASLGSYLMSVEGRRAFRARRIE